MHFCILFSGNRGFLQKLLQFYAIIFIDTLDSSEGMIRYIMVA